MHHVLEAVGAPPSRAMLKHRKKIAHACMQARSTCALSMMVVTLSELVMASRISVPFCSLVPSKCDLNSGSTPADLVCKGRADSVFAKMRLRDALHAAPQSVRAANAVLTLVNLLCALCQTEAMNIQALALVVHQLI